MKNVIEARGISKQFPGVKALEQVSFSVSSGEIHALCGENGAGKSTLMKIFSGLHAHGSYEGEFFVEGEEQTFRSTEDSIKARIAIVYQELSLVPDLTVAENIFLGREPSRFAKINWTKLFSEAAQLLTSLGVEIDPRSKVKELGIGEMQLVEIAKALSQRPKILILDEPTSALSANEIKIFASIIKKLKSLGTSVILITHKLNEIFSLSDRITILRDGKTIATHQAQDLDEEKLISQMVGREIRNLFPHNKEEFGETVLQVANLSAPHPTIKNHWLLNNISWEVRRGEVLGFAGLMGAGRTEMFMAIFGALEAQYDVELILHGQRIKVKSPADALSAGLALATEDRKRYGLVLENPVTKNLTLSGLRSVSSWGIIANHKENLLTQQYIQKFRIKTPGPHALVKNLSGGNQQKVVLSKCLVTKPKVLFLDEPTRGIDVGAKAEIYQWIDHLRTQGLSIVLISSELPELLGLSDRILVMCEGTITAEFDRAEASETKILEAATRFQRTYLQ